MTHAEACAKLSPREREVLPLLCSGMSSKGAADQLGLSWHTVKHHAKSARNKLGVSTMREAAVIATKAGIL